MLTIIRTDILRVFLIPLPDNVLLNKSFGGPFCARNGLDVAALKTGDLEPLERESFTNGLISSWNSGNRGILLTKCFNG